MSPLSRKAAAARRLEHEALMKAQIADGSLKVRQASDEERAEWEREGEQPRQPRPLVQSAP